MHIEFINFGQDPTNTSVAATNKNTEWIESSKQLQPENHYIYID